MEVEQSAASAVRDLRARGGCSFEDFYQREYRSLLALAWSLTGRMDLGEELVQETMFKVNRRWSTVAYYERPGAFARRVLLNDATTAWRRRMAEKRALGRLRSMTEIAQEPPPLPDEAFWAVVRALPGRQSQAIALHYLEDRPVAEIAEVLGISANTVKVHLHRGRLALADRLGNGEEEER